MPLCGLTTTGRRLVGRRTATLARRRTSPGLGRLHLVEIFLFVVLVFDVLCIFDVGVIGIAEVLVEPSRQSFLQDLDVLFVLAPHRREELLQLVVFLGI